MKVADLIVKLATVEETEPSDLQNKVSPTIRQDNEKLRSSGSAVRFRTFGDGTAPHGHVGIHESHAKKPLKNPQVEIPEYIEAANNAVKKQLKEAIQNLSWQEFESSFMTQVLKALGFAAVEVTQRTRDGGVDARCFYNRGIIRSEAIVSAKLWKGNVGVNEVNRMKGINGNHDTVIIFTSASFKGPAKVAAKPSPRQGPVFLIDGDYIVDTCFSEGIGVKSVATPDMKEFTGLEPESEETEIEESEEN